MRHISTRGQARLNFENVLLAGSRPTGGSVRPGNLRRSPQEEIASWAGPRDYEPAFWVMCSFVAESIEM